MEKFGFSLYVDVLYNVMFFYMYFLYVFFYFYFLLCFCALCMIFMLVRFFSYCVYFI